MKTGFITFCLLLLMSCAKTTDQKVADALDVAQTHLSDGECDKAIKVLEDVGNQAKDAVYLQVLASAYACRAGFSTIKFIADDVEDINTSSFQAMMKSLTTLTYSRETVADSVDYKNMLAGINILLRDSTTRQPSQAQRTKDFGARKAGDMGVEVLIFSIVQLGKFLHLYGNVDADGDKGDGAGTNNCFINYTFATAQTVRAASGGACASNSDGHPSLSILAPDTSKGRRRRCEGLILFNNILDVLDNLDVSGIETFSDLAKISEQASSVKDTAIETYPALETLLETTSQLECEELLESSSESNNLELIYALLFEAGLQ